MKTHVLRSLALCLAALTLSALASGCGKETVVVVEAPRQGLDMGYAAEATVSDDPDALQKWYDEAKARANGPSLTTEYQENAFSKNGIDFDCYLANSPLNELDAYYEIHGDIAFEDELYKSDLLRPGTALRKITLNHALNPGEHEVYVTFNQVMEQDGVLDFYQKRVFTVTFHVTQE